MARTVSCNDCSLSSVCLPLAVAPDQVDELDRILKRGRSLKRGEHLYNAQDPFRSVYAVRSGAIKTYNLTEEGEQQITGFYLPGEVVGMDGISTAHYASSAQALETSAVCEVPFDQMESLSLQIPSLQRHFFELMSQEIKSDRELHMLLSHKSAEDRIAALLLSLSARANRRGLSPEQLRLPMPRNEMANYLGLAVETVSRIMTRLHQQGVLRVDGREVAILDRDHLCQHGEFQLNVQNI
jgi:CRP/FNR family transcriptional regulator